MPKKGASRGSTAAGQGQQRRGGGSSQPTSLTSLYAVLLAVAAAVAALAFRVLSGTEAARTVEEAPLDPASLMASMKRVEEQKPVSLSDVGNQLRFFCADELDARGAGGKGDSGRGGPPTRGLPATKNCQTFLKSIPRVAKALEKSEPKDDMHLGTDAAVHLDQRLAAALRLTADLDSLQAPILRLAAVVSTGSAADWPRSFLSLLTLHTVHGDDQPRWEKEFIRTRSQQLSDVVAADTNRDPKVNLALIAALACQASHTDYAWIEQPEERLAVDSLVAGLGAEPKPGDRGAHARLAVIGAFRPLVRVVEAWGPETLAAWRTAYPEERKRGGDGWQFWELWRLAVEEPLVERQLRERLAAEASGSDAPHGSASKEVRAMYESNPYPKWSWEHPGVDWPERLSDHLTSKGWSIPPQWPKESLDRPKVLVAGCGTGHWMTHFARHYKDHVDVWAVDLSLSSLSFAKRKAQQMGLTNVRFVQGDILALPDVLKREAPFDMIESGGVLHHMSDPREGWGRLVELLRPGGPMLVAFYSKIARAQVVDPCRNFARKGRYNTSSALSLRRYRADVLKLVDEGVAWAKEITSSRDFVSLNGVRDLCLHIQETQYTMLELEAMLDELGLRFVQMQETVTEDKQERFRRMFSVDPFSPDATPTLWHKFEEKHPRTFLGMYEFFVQSCHGPGSCVL